MGQTISEGSCCCHKYRVKVVMLGLDNAGKTAILYKLKTNELVETVPTYSFNRVTLDHRNIRYKVWDFGGRQVVRQLWNDQLTGASGVVFVVDSTDHDRMNLAADALANVLSSNHLSSGVILVLANKQDLPDAMNPLDIAKRLRLSKITRRHQRWHLQPTEAIHGNGLLEGLDWMSDTLLQYHLRPECPCRLPCIYL